MNVTVGATDGLRTKCYAGATDGLKTNVIEGVTDGLRNKCYRNCYQWRLEYQMLEMIPLNMIEYLDLELLPLEHVDI